MIDANVFSYMLDFDMSNDLSMRLEPTVIEPINQYAFAPGRYSNSAFGLRMGIRF